MSAPYIPLGDDWQVNAVTPWFPGSVKPANSGVYEVRHPKTAPIFSRWDGVLWYSVSITPDRAAMKFWASDYQNLPWRGLAQDPKGKP